MAFAILSISNPALLSCHALGACHTRRRGEIRGQSEMEHFYKNHRIEIWVRLDGNDWAVSLFIYYSEGLQNRLATFPMNQVFKTYDDALEAGLAAAKKWIDGSLSDAVH
jgi:hypothetical protein